MHAGYLCQISYKTSANISIMRYQLTTLVGKLSHCNNNIILDYTARTYCKKKIKPDHRFYTSCKTRKMNDIEFANKNMRYISWYLQSAV